MDKGPDFLKSQVNNAVMQHKAFVESLQSHADEAEDQRFATLCTTHLTRMMEHQRQLEQYQRSLGAEAGTAKKVIGQILEAGKDVVDSARGDDFLRLVGDIVMARQAEDTFKTFREAGRRLDLEDLARIGDMGERDHDDYVRDANRLVQDMFVEHVQTGVPIGR